MEWCCCAAIRFAPQKRDHGGHAGNVQLWLCEIYLEGKSITCRSMHATIPPKAVCWVGDSDVASFLLSQGWAELADDVTEATYKKPWPPRRAKRLASGETVRREPGCGSLPNLEIHRGCVYRELHPC